MVGWGMFVVTVTLIGGHRLWLGRGLIFGLFYFPQPASQMGRPTRKHTSDHRDKCPGGLLDLLFDFWIFEGVPGARHHVG